MLAYADDLFVISRKKDRLQKLLNAALSTATDFDIIVKDDNKVLIIDVCCPFDNNAEALRDAEQPKLNKYEGLKQFFVGQGKQCQVFGFVIGALGSWHPANENVLRELGMSKCYRSLFPKSCCTDEIQGSTNIYREHLRLTDGSPVPDNSE